jgi:GT2 family glycosyltransferase
MPRPGVTITHPPQAPEAPAASIIIVAYGKRPVSEACLTSLEAALGDRLGGEYELVLVDNASPDDTAALFRAWSDRAVVVSIDHNANYAGGNNEGAAVARGETLVLMNNDIEVPGGALEALVETARRPGVGIAGLRLLYPDGGLQHGGVGFFRVRDGLPVPYHLFHHQAGDLPSAACELELDVVTAACMAMPRRVFAELGGFDERYVNGWEDTDLCLRSRMAGHRTIYRGDLTMVHHEGVSRGRVQTPRDIGNMQAFFGRWGTLLEPDEELVAELFDAEFVAPTAAPEDGPGGALLSVEGQVTGLAPEADEARALLTALEHAGLQPAARDVPFAFLAPRLDADERELIARARARHRASAAMVVHVPVGTRLRAADAAPVLRLAGVPAGGLREVGLIWAASPEAAAAFVDAGVPSERVAWLPPAVPEFPLGDGGDGVLAVLPAHDLAAARAALDELARLAPDGIRVLPTAVSAPLADLVRRLAPEAELLGPCSSERRFAALSARADVVICADVSDRFQRRALVAGAAGAAPVTFLRGAASAVLGAEVAGPGALERALGTTDTRRARRAAVLEHCAGPVVAARVGGLLGVSARA